VSHLLQFWIYWSQINPVIPNPYELPAGAIFFLGAYVVVRRLLPRIARALEARADAIDGGRQRAADVDAEAARLRAQYRAVQADARHEAAELRHEAVAQGARYLTAQREEAEFQAARMVDAARARLEVEYQDAYASLRPEVSEFAVDLASRIVGEPLQSA
jgi:F-type H+-transporting ATPase subunit b